MDDITRPERGSEEWHDRLQMLGWLATGTHWPACDDIAGSCSRCGAVGSIWYVGDQSLCIDCNMRRLKQIRDMS